MTSQERRDYQRKYYLQHKEKCQAYAREYNLKIKKNVTAGWRGDKTPWQRIPKTVITASEFVHSLNAEKLLNKILDGRLNITT